MLPQRRQLRLPLHALDMLRPVSRQGHRSLVEDCRVAPDAALKAGPSPVLGTLDKIRAQSIVLHLAQHH